MSNYYGNDYAREPNRQYYGTPQQDHSNYPSYQPPRDDGYKHDMAMARYDDERARYHDNRPSPRGSSDRYYDDRRPEYEERDRRKSRSQSRRRSRSSRRSQGERGFFGSEGDKEHSKGKDIGATLIGGAVGAYAGRELGHGGLASTIGAVAGAFAGHKLEKRYEKNKEKREAGQQYDSYDPGRRSIDYEDSDDGYGDQRRRDHHHRRDSDRWK
ncbi:hypothetical protein LTS08_004386 [Lithohypha guttulata]|uniref:Glycine zipper 2TM domain-containing protein n=1 Tax=Lithohypha guttulata TaxID=1690604 RepID=A0AAN7T1A6_9EURO|nr:hypothetical protein LTR05_003472 [Lithohypha guttulata]KAK5101927.1 hypothetical protein LTS08_004386 [Lithohypha guttulata]